MMLMMMVMMNMMMMKLMIIKIMMMKMMIYLIYDRKKYMISLAVSNPRKENIQRVEDVETHEARKRESPQLSSHSSS